MRNLKIFLLIWLFSLGAWITTMAEEKMVQAQYIGEDDENGYTYNCPGIGEFSTNIGTDLEGTFAVFLPKGDTRGELYLNGHLQSFQNEIMSIDAGKYEFRLYKNRGDTESYGTFSFQITQNIADINNGEKFQIQDSPEMAIHYDQQKKHYCYTLPNGSDFFMSIPDGGITTGAVTIEIPEVFSVLSISLDGRALADLEQRWFEEPGTYQISCMGGQSNDLLGDSGFYRFTISFMIMPYYENTRDIINPPVGFKIVRASCDGIQLPVDENYLMLQKDGTYEVLFAENQEEKSGYQLKFHVDRKAPVLEFSKSIYEPMVYPPLTYQVTEKNVTVQIARNGESILYSGETLKEGGYYCITVMDKAGNKQSYEFCLGHSFHIQYQIIIILSFIAAVGGILWLLHQRRNMRIL